MRLPTLQETTEVITACIQSCKNQPQLNTCREMIDTFIKEKYQHHETAATMAVLLSDLDELIETKKVQIGFEAGQRAAHGITA